MNYGIPTPTRVEAAGHSTEVGPGRRTRPVAGTVHRPSGAVRSSHELTRPRRAPQGAGMSLLLPQTRVGIVQSATPVNIHGDRYMDVAIALDGEAGPPVRGRVVPALGLPTLKLRKISSSVGGFSSFSCACTMELSKIADAKYFMFILRMYSIRIVLSDIETTISVASPKH